MKPLDVDIIEEDLGTSCLGSKVVVYKSTSSTNDVAWEYARNRSNSGLAVFAEEQTKGRGRRGNKWLSETGTSLLCSMLILDCKCPGELMTTASAVAAAEAINTAVNVNTRIKWPNDIMLNSKKLAGILLESRPCRSGHDYVIGIGINCSQPAEFFDNTELLMPATSLSIETADQIDRNKLARCVLKSFDRWFKTAIEKPDKIINRWTQLSTLLGTNLTVKYLNEYYTGTCTGIDLTEGLILQLDRGGVRIFEAGKTTIVKRPALKKPLNS